MMGPYYDYSISVFDGIEDASARSRCDPIGAITSRLWAKTPCPVIHQSIRDAQAQLHTGHQDIRTYSSNAIAAAPTITTTPPTTNTVLLRTFPPPSTLSPATSA
jgi:hypothetical protein